MILWVVKSSAILLGTWIAVRLLRRQSAAVRHLIWTAGLIASLAVPLLTGLLPSWHPVNFGTEEEWTSPLPAPAQDVAGTYVIQVTPQDAVPFFLRPEIPFIVWAAGFALALSVLLGGAARLAWVVFRAEPVTSERWIHAAAGISRAFNLNRRIRVLRHPHSSTLGTFGILRGRILLPRDAESWSDERIRVVLAHELAHIKRFDWVVQIVAEFARAIHWFNPLFWIACERLRQESEHSCDDAVLNLGIDGQTYAAHLLELARAFKNSGRAWSPVLAMAQPPHLERRFVAMLNPSLNRRPINGARLALVVLVTIGLTLPLAAMQDQKKVRPVIEQLEVPQSTTPARARPVAVAAAAPAAVPAKPSRAPARAIVQEGSASIFGTVSDASGAFIPGALVTLLNLDSVSQQDVVSNEAGSFDLLRLLPARYLIQIRLPGFQTFNSGLIQLQGNQRFQQNVTLVVGTISQRVVVRAQGTRKPASNPAVPRRIRIGGNIQAANLISPVKPDYPQSARDAGVEGTVRMQGIIGADGSMLSLQVLNEGQVDPELASSARGAASQWRYRPTLLNGEPVEVITTIEVNFRLAQ